MPFTVIPRASGNPQGGAAMHRIVILDLIQNLGADRHSGLDPESRQGHGGPSFPMPFTVIPRGSGNPQGGGCLTVTLTFDSSPIKGEELLVGVVLLFALPSPLWIADQVQNDEAPYPQGGGTKPNSEVAYAEPLDRGECLRAKASSGE